MTEDEIAAVHEAAHAVIAVFGDWTKLHGPVALKPAGCGDVVMSTDSEAIRRTIAADPGFDGDLPRIQLVRALLAGPMAERMLVDSGRARLTRGELRDGARGDYAVAADQLAQLVRPRPALLEQLEREVRAQLEQPTIWSAVVQFALILLDRRRMEADEASAILQRIAREQNIQLSPPEEETDWLPLAGGFLVFAAAAAALWFR